MSLLCAEHYIVYILLLIVKNVNYMGAGGHFLLPHYNFSHVIAQEGYQSI